MYLSLSVLSCRFINMRFYIIYFAVCIFFLACAEAPSVSVDEEGSEKILLALLEADSGAVIEIPEGFFAFKRSLSLDGVPGVTIKGAGMGKSILSFDNQIDGAEGLLIKADQITLEDFTIQDSKGDAIKVQDAEGIVFRRVETTWTHGAREDNGGYGIYPVGCTSVLIEGCEASYAADAGIYVGQSNQVVMRDNYAHHNVAGLEIENSRNVEAYNNLAEENTGGLLIFDMPGLPQANGYNVKVYNNTVRSNNHKNFAPEGGVVSTLPPGTGMLIIAHRDVEVYNNEVTDYKTLGLGVISWYLTERPFETDNGFDPYYSNVSVHDNTFQRRRAIPDITKEFGQMLNGLFIGKPQDIVVDGIFENDGVHLCLKNNGEDLRFANLNAETASDLGDLKKLVDRNMDRFNCDLPSFDVIPPAL